MDYAAAIQIVESFLRDRLKHTGASGFEGLVAVLIQEGTGQEFRLSSSGRQFGGDATSESGTANTIRVESKHYREETPLDLRELIAEIHEAADSNPHLDIWVLATSRSVSDQIVSALDAQAETRGVEVVVLDLGINGLPRLAVLMAAFPGLVQEWAQRHALAFDAHELQSALLMIAQVQGFLTTKTRLLAKLSCNAGFDSARRHAYERIVQTLSDPSNARTAFRQRLNIRDPGVHIVRRAELKRMLDAWWDIEGVPVPAVALGEEGTGKTWAVFDWVLGRFHSEGSPIILPFAAIAQFRSGDSVKTLLPRLLAKWSGLLDESKWVRRLDRWMNAPVPGRSLILLVADGLNERANVDWRPFLSEVSSDPWRRLMAVIATDRPHHWKRKCSAASVVPFHRIPVAGYTEDELDLALSGNGISHRDIPDELLPLISIPRYSRLVAGHYGEMVASADFTRERLIYLEIKDRQSSKLQYPLSDEEVHQLIRGLAGRALTNTELNPRDLRDLIAVPGGDEANIYEELLSGGLLVAVSGKTDKYKVEPIRLVYGFGMLLAEELSSLSSSSESEIAEFLTAWFEPQPDMERKVEICGAAMFHALFQNDFPEVPLRELVRYGLGLRHWVATAQGAFERYILRRPQIFLDVAESFWSSTDDSVEVQELLGSAFVAYRDDLRLQPHLVAVIERWMSFIHPLGRDPWMFEAERRERLRRSVAQETRQTVLSLPFEVDAEERTRQAIEARAGCLLVDGEIEVAGVKLTVISDGALLRMPRVGLMVMSAGDLSPFIHSLVSWAVASAVMDEEGFHKLVSWVVRLAELGTSAILLELARRLLLREEDVAREAARILLYAIDTSESEAVVREHRLTPDWHNERLAKHVSDPCISFYPWTHKECLSCLGREDVPLHIILERALLAVVDPTVSLPASLISRANDALHAIDPKMIRASTGQTVEGHLLEVLTPILCSHAPGEVATFLRGVINTLPKRDLNGQYALSIMLPQLSLLLGEEGVLVVSQAMAAFSSDAAEWSNEDETGPRRTTKIMEARAFAGLAPHLHPSELWTRFLNRSKSAWDLMQLDPWFAPLPTDELPRQTELLAASSDLTTIYRVLRALRTTTASFSDAQKDRLVELADHENARIRAYATRAIALANDDALARRVIDLRRTLNRETDPFEAHWHTYLLAHYGGHLPLDEIAKRLRVPEMGFVLGQRGNHPDEIELYAEFLDQEWRRIVTASDSESVCLPKIAVDNDSTDTGARFPDLGRVHTIDNNRV